MQRNANMAKPCKKRTAWSIVQLQNCKICKTINCRQNAKICNIAKSKHHTCNKNARQKEKKYLANCKTNAQPQLDCTACNAFMHLHWQSSKATFAKTPSNCSETTKKQAEKVGHCNAKNTIKYKKQRTKRKKKSKSAKIAKTKPHQFATVFAKQSTKKLHMACQRPKSKKKNKKTHLHAFAFQLHKQKHKGHLNKNLHLQQNCIAKNCKKKSIAAQKKKMKRKIGKSRLHFQKQKNAGIKLRQNICTKQFATKKKKIGKNKKQIACKGQAAKSLIFQTKKKQKDIAKKTTTARKKFANSKQNPKMATKAIKTGKSKMQKTNSAKKQKQAKRTSICNQKTKKTKMQWGQPQAQQIAKKTKRQNKNCKKPFAKKKKCKKVSISNHLQSEQKHNAAHLHTKKPICKLVKICNICKKKQQLQHMHLPALHTIANCKQHCKQKCIALHWHTTKTAKISKGICILSKKTTKKASFPFANKESAKNTKILHWGAKSNKTDICKKFAKAQQIAKMHAKNKQNIEQKIAQNKKARKQQKLQKNLQSMQQQLHKLLNWQHCIAFANAMQLH